MGRNTYPYIRFEFILSTWLFDSTKVTIKKKKKETCTMHMAFKIYDKIPKTTRRSQSSCIVMGHIATITSTEFDFVPSFYQPSPCSSNLYMNMFKRRYPWDKFITDGIKGCCMFFVWCLTHFNTGNCRNNKS